MPLYEYQCDECRNTFDKLVRMDSDHHVSCTSCSSENVHRLMSRFAMVGGYDDTFTAGEMQSGGCCGGSCGCGH